MTRLPGHELFNEGAPHDKKGRRTSFLNYTTKGEGHGKCTCGALSENLSSGAQRKKWHREHKEAMRGVK